MSGTKLYRLLNIAISVIFFCRQLLVRMSSSQHQACIGCYLRLFNWALDSNIFRLICILRLVGLIKMYNFNSIMMSLYLHYIQIALLHYLQIALPTACSIALPTACTIALLTDCTIALLTDCSIALPTACTITLLTACTIALLTACTIALPTDCTITLEIQSCNTAN